MKLITHNLKTVGKGFDKIQWSPMMLQILVENYNRLTNHQLAAALQLRITSVRMKLYELGYKRMEMEYWTEEQVAFLVANYRTMGDVPMYRHFEKAWPKNKQWTTKHIRKKRLYLNLHRTPAEVEAIREANRLKLGAPLGDVRVWHGYNRRYFKVIKLEKGWSHYAPWLWQQLNGPVPEGYVVTFKDGNNLNVVPENIEIVTQAELITRAKSYPPELMEIIKLFNHFKNTVIQLEDGQQDKEEHG